MARSHLTVSERRLPHEKRGEGQGLMWGGVLNLKKQGWRRKLNRPLDLVTAEGAYQGVTRSHEKQTHLFGYRDSYSTATERKNH